MLAPSSACSPAKRAERTPGAPPSAVDDETGIVCDRRNPRDACRMTRLQQRVLDERDARLGRLRHAELGLRGHA